MSIDVKIEQNFENVFDISILNGDLEAVEGFETALYLSLCTDARADASQVALPEDRRGWVGDLVSPVEGRPLGGYLWLVEQRRLVQATVNEAVDYTRKALNWMIEDGLLIDVEVLGEIVVGSGIALEINLTPPNGRTSTHYVKLWELTGE